MTRKGTNAHDILFFRCAQCVENQNPALKTLPLGIRQKGILATCNYVARRKGVGKLTTLVEAKRLCPDLVIVDGEDLSPFRDVSKQLYALLRSFSWNAKIERLGLDEMFLDVTDMVTYNLEMLNRSSLKHSYFCLSRSDPERGFPYDATSFTGCVYRGDGNGNDHGDDDTAGEAQECHLDNPLYMRLLIASHLAKYLRHKIEEEGYTTACGIATNKALAKLVGNMNKPQNQTTLLALRQDVVLCFMDGHKLRKVPGIGSKTTRILEGFVLGMETDTDIYSMECSVTVGQVRTHPGIQSPPVLDNLLGGPRSERGLAGKAWALLHGVDDSEVKPAKDVPTQISIEDTYKGLNELSEIRREMLLIAASLLRRMRVDLLAHPQTQQQPPAQGSRWLVRPRTIRLSTRPYASPLDNKPHNWARTSRSTSLPSFALSLIMPPEQIVEKLVSETLMPLFYKINPSPRGWNTGLINVCVTNMVGGVNSGGARDRDIGAMFRRQDDAIKEFTSHDEVSGRGESGGNTLGRSIRRGVGDSETETVVAVAENEPGPAEGEENSFQSDGGWDEQTGHNSSQDGGAEKCPLCGHSIPMFALKAHRRFHNMELDEG